MTQAVLLEVLVALVVAMDLKFPLIMQHQDNRVQAAVQDLVLVPIKMDNLEVQA